MKKISNNFRSIYFVALYSAIRIELHNIIPAVVWYCIAYSVYARMEFQGHSLCSAATMQLLRISPRTRLSFRLFPFIPLCLSLSLVVAALEKIALNINGATLFGVRVRKRFVRSKWKIECGIESRVCTTSDYSRRSRKILFPSVLNVFQCQWQQSQIRMFQPKLCRPRHLRPQNRNKRKTFVLLSSFCRRKPRNENGRPLRCAIRLWITKIS